MFPQKFQNQQEHKTNHFAFDRWENQDGLRKSPFFLLATSTQLGSHPEDSLTAGFFAGGAKFDPYGKTMAEATGGLAPRGSRWVNDTGPSCHGRFFSLKKGSWPS